MSRIGNSPITLPEGVTLDMNNEVITIKGKLGELSQEIKDISVKVEDGTVSLERPSESKDHKAKHGLYRALINNLALGTSLLY